MMATIIRRNHLTFSRLNDVFDSPLLSVLLQNLLHELSCMHDTCLATANRDAARIKILVNYHLRPGVTLKFLYR